jgi:hypothetical protein
MLWRSIESRPQTVVALACYVQETNAKITDKLWRLYVLRQLNVLLENSACSAYDHPSIMLIIYNVHKTNDTEYVREYHKFLVQFLLRIILARKTLIISIVKTVALLRWNTIFAFSSTNCDTFVQGVRKRTCGTANWDGSVCMEMGISRWGVSPNYIIGFDGFHGELNPGGLCISRPHGTAGPLYSENVGGGVNDSSQVRLSVALYI